MKKAIVKELRNEVVIMDWQIFRRSYICDINNFSLMILLFPIFFFFSARDGVMGPGVSRSSENKRLTDGE